jgi:hypothetical protein
MYASRAISVLAFLILVLAGASPGAARAEAIKVLNPQGSAHGYVEVTTLDGTRIGVGDLLQRLHGTVVTSRLLMHFFDGSIDDETTAYSELGTFHFISDHHIQRGPSFPQPIDVMVDAKTGMVSSTDSDGKVVAVHFKMPGDVYNGMASTLLMNIDPRAPETRIAAVVASAKPRLIHLSMKNGGGKQFTIGGITRTATDFVVHVELGGVAGVVAPLIGKEPTDYHVLLVTGPDPVFIREEGALYVGGPVWRIQQISAVIPD